MSLGQGTPVYWVENRAGIAQANRKPSIRHKAAGRMVVHRRIMTAVIRAGGKQYRAEEGAILEIELPKKGLTAGERLTTDEVLLIEGNGSIQVGTPRVAGAKAVLEVLEEIRAPKVVAFRYRRRKGYHRTVGHRQRLARVRVVEIAIDKEAK